MILAELHLENYKQYQGEHRIEFPPQGVVAVIGANGVGKTTLFEAIEWCLYNPREIENAEVPPRGGVGRTLVKVVLEDSRDGVRYTVERGLRRGVTSAEVYRDGQEAPLVQGTRQVSEYVARRLIGLGHRAFVSTFFTRQKELTFFGTLRDTDRRREVGRLLGLETIREAQRLVGEERQLARTEAAGLKLQYAEQSAGRDFPAEIAAAEATIAIQEASVAAAAAERERSAAAAAAARADLERWRGLERGDEALRRELARIGGEERAAGARREAEDAALRRLDEADATRQELLPLRAAEPARRQAVAAHVAERERWERHRVLGADLARAEAAGQSAAREMAQTVGAVETRGAAIAGWGWTDADAADPPAAAERLLTATARLEMAAAEVHADRLADCRRRIDERDAAQVKFDRYRRALAELDRERAQLLADGEPAAAAAEAQRAREAALGKAESSKARAAAAADDRRRLEGMSASLRVAAGADVCPTCQRPFKPEEVETALLVWAQAIKQEEAREAALAKEGRAAERRAAAAENARVAAQEKLQRLVKIEGRIAQGAPMVEEATATFDSLVATCAAAVDDLGLDREPTEDEVSTAKERAATLRRVEQARTLLLRLADAARAAAAEAEVACGAMAALGSVAYDRAAHAAAERELEAAVAAAARITEIDAQLARRPEHATARAAASAEIERLRGERERVERERVALGFDVAVLEAATATETRAREATEAATLALTTAEAAVRDAARQRDALAAEAARLAALATRAATREREADDLQRMYGEFSRFDQYVAAKVTPQLAEQTGDLLAAVTEGKYDRVVFDDNYGLRIFDEDEDFPIEEFSGGERDVAALCARLALSRLIGAQAVNPPRFLVLDEVFGSLDQERRAQVLGTLGALAASPEEVAAGNDAFRQLFIVSHVDDVRLSAVVDEVWRVTDVGGVSRWENATRSGGVEDL